MLFSLPLVASADSIADAGDLTDFIVNIARYTSWPGDVASKGLTVWLGSALPEDGWTHLVRVSIGVAVLPDHGDDVTNFMQAADWAMYKAKTLSQDESIRVAAAVPMAMRASVLRSEASNVIAIPIQGHKVPRRKS